MTLELLSDAFIWMAIINYAILLFWFIFFAYAREFVYRLHTRWFKISPENFDLIHYAGIAFYKIGIFLFALVPWIALQIIR